MTIKAKGVKVRDGNEEILLHTSLKSWQLAPFRRGHRPSHSVLSKLLSFSCHVTVPLLIFCPFFRDMLLIGIWSTNFWLNRKRNLFYNKNKVDSLSFTLPYAQYHTTMMLYEQWEIADSCTVCNINPLLQSNSCGCKETKRFWSKLFKSHVELNSYGEFKEGTAVTKSPVSACVFVCGCESQGQVMTNDGKLEWRLPAAPPPCQQRRIGGIEGPEKKELVENAQTNTQTGRHGAHLHTKTSGWHDVRRGTAPEGDSCWGSLCPWFHLSWFSVCF